MRRTTKQIAEKYKGNLDYYRKPHYMRRLRGWAFAIVVIGSLAVALGYHRFGGKPEFFNTGPLTADHAQFQNRCDVCHTDARPDLASVLKLDRAVDKARGLNADSVKKLPEESLQLVNLVHGGVDSTLDKVKSGSLSGGIDKLTAEYVKHADLSKMDHAC